MHLGLAEHRTGADRSHQSRLNQCLARPNDSTVHTVRALDRPQPPPGSAPHTGPSADSLTRFVTARNRLHRHSLAGQQHHSARPETSLSRMLRGQLDPHHILTRCSPPLKSTSEPPQTGGESMLCYRSFIRSADRSHQSRLNQCLAQSRNRMTSASISARHYQLSKLHTPPSRPDPEEDVGFRSEA